MADQADQFKPGDVVKLKSGGPKMTVDSVGTFLPGDDIQAKCVWFEGKKMYVEILSLASLVHTHR